MRTLVDVVTDARNAGTPLVAVQTPDQFAAMDAICKAENGNAKVRWDATTGLVGLNAAGTAFTKTLGDETELRQTSTNPQTALELLDKLPNRSMAFMLNAHRFVEDAIVATGILMKREPFKKSERTLFLMGPRFNLPAELRQDVVVLEDPLPDDATLRDMTVKLAAASGAPVTDEDADRAVDALRGLSKFAAEQVLAMSFREDGIDTESLWDRKRTQVAQVKGLSLQSGGPRRDQIGGNAAIIDFAERLVTGNDAPRAIYLWDEIEKHFGSTAGPNANSVDTDALSVGLTEMEDNGHDGIICLSPPGCGKTMFARALAATYNLPLVQFDFGAMKGRYVGDSEGAIREAFKVANGIAAGRALVVATCNKLDALPPELRRRFTNGIWFFDLPDAEERAEIWKVQLKAHGLADDPLVAPGAITFDEGWTGAEIRNCCRIASRLRITLAEAATYIVPVSQSDPKSVEALRSLAEGRFLSANYPGTYTRNRKTDGERKVRLAKES